MVSKDFFKALKELEIKKGINQEEFVETLESALTSAYKKNYGEGKSALVKLNAERSTIKIYSYKTVVDEVKDPDKEISLEDAKEIKKNITVGKTLEQEEQTKEFGRIAAQTAKQVIMQKIREAETKQLVELMSERQDKLTTTVIKRVDADNNVFVDINGVEAIMPRREQMKNETYNQGDRIKVYVKHINETARDVQLIVSRSDYSLVRKLFELEIPEIQSGEIEIKAVSRDAGSRSKVAIFSNNEEIDPIGACVGNRGARINSILSELNGEKIDLVLYSENPAQFIANALSPAKVLEVEINEDEKTSRVIVPDDKLSLAIGKSGQNVRLAARLTKWKIDVKPESDYEELKNMNVDEELKNIDINIDDIDKNIDDSIFDIDKL